MYDPPEVEAREHFKSAITAALVRDEGDGLEESYHTLNTFAAYGVAVRLESTSTARMRWAIELRLDPIHVAHESENDLVTALKETFLLFIKQLNRRPSNPRLSRG